MVMALVLLEALVVLVVVQITVVALVVAVDTQVDQVNLATTFLAVLVLLGEELFQAEHLEELMAVQDMLQLRGQHNAK
jgi:hypothetical protein